jgi:hypothetical protein
MPVEKRLSGDFGSPLELLAAQGLTAAEKRQILEVWLDDLAAQPDTPERQAVLDSVRDALSSLERQS